MRFPSNKLVPSGGEIYCHLFENRHTGVERNLYWSVTVDFEPIQYGEDEFACSLTCEWITWPVRDWRELDGRQLDVRGGQDLVEASFYMSRHDPATQTRLSLRHYRANEFRVVVDMLVDFHGYYGDDANPAMPVHAEAEVPYIGVLVNPENLFPKPLTPAEVENAVAPFADLSSYEEPEPWRHRSFILRPKWSAA